jgi:hypothetical protein
MVAAGEVDVDWHVEGDPRLDMLGDLERVPLGVGGRELAAAAARAGDEAGADARRARRQPERLDARLRISDIAIRDAGQDEVLPDREPDIAVAAFARERREPAHLVGGELADRQHHAEPVQARLRLRMPAHMREAVRRGARRDMLLRDAREGAAEPRLDGSEEALEAPGIEEVFQPRPLAVLAVPVLDEHPHHRVRDRDAVGGGAEHAGRARDVAVARDAAEDDAHPDPLLRRRAGGDAHGLEADVVRLLEHRDAAAAVEGDVELARQAVERAVVEDVEVPRAGERAGVEDLLRVDPGAGRAGHVADIVGAGAAGAEAEILQAFEEGRAVLGRDLAHLQIGAGGDVAVAAAEPLGEVGEACELPVVEDAVRQAQAAHVGGLRRRDPEQAVIAPAEIVLRLRGLAVAGRGREARMGVERVLGALPGFLVCELAARRHDLVLRALVDRLRTGRLGCGGRRRRRQATGRPRGVEAGREALEIAFLFRVEAAHGFHAAMRSASADASDGPNIRVWRKAVTSAPERMRSRYQGPCATSPTRQAPTRRSPSRTSLR